MYNVECQIRSILDHSKGVSSHVREVKNASGTASWVSSLQHWQQGKLVTARVKIYLVICANSRRIWSKVNRCRYSYLPLPMPHQMEAKKCTLSIPSLYSTWNRIMTINFTSQFYSTRKDLRVDHFSRIAYDEGNLTTAAASRHVPRQRSIFTYRTDITTKALLHFKVGFQCCRILQKLFNQSNKLLFSVDKILIN